MSALALTKLYGDLALLFKADIDALWTQLEAKINGSLDSDNVLQDWASWNMVTLAKDVSYTLGTTSSGVVRFYSASTDFAFAHDTTIKQFFFKVGGSTVGTLDTSGNFTSSTDIYFSTYNTTYPLSYLIGYQKPVLVYSDGTTINMEQNTTTANRSLVVFPCGPIHVTEDIASTHKFRQLKTSASANGYGSSHTGVADSGMKVGLSLTANTWYFVYAVVVQYGSDAGSNFIMVVDSTNPSPSNWSTLDSSYGAGKWVYLGLFRYGHGAGATTTMIPFIADHQGWHSFVGRLAIDNLFGIGVANQTINSTTYTTVETFTAADSGDAAPSTCSAMKVSLRILPDADGFIAGHVLISDSSDNVAINLPGFGTTYSSSDPHGYEFKIVNQGLKLKAKRGSSSTDDYDLQVYISAVLDEWV